MVTNPLSRPDIQELERDAMLAAPQYNCVCGNPESTSFEQRRKRNEERVSAIGAVLCPKVNRSPEALKSCTPYTNCTDCPNYATLLGLGVIATNDPNPLE